MYKVFVNDKPIILTSSLNKENNYPVYILKNVVIDELIYKLKNEQIKGINLYTSDLESGWNIFINNFKVVSAAGGLVLNSKKELLFIYRNDKWDLPKGRIEKGESIETAAIREVEEECGIFELIIQQKLITTYHLYYQNGTKIKETHWFLMTSDYKKELIPQLEEGITKVNFFPDEEIPTKLKNSYGNIKLVYDTFKEV
ncbi:NUDIX domain-containing protein [Polaribacter sp. MSW13]|uniref:NUDIX domain-containing protein n=1 Tax=Polaribacter marinus TaxID=2916838 RepID=A0A9X1VS56_9FLAO|nr:NUDIX domain-containing protein [Polaribacter marinus]MCI2230092.1 NUDIX domain-containing protein [Polaribacter marinus]